MAKRGVLFGHGAAKRIIRTVQAYERGGRGTDIGRGNYLNGPTDYGEHRLAQIVAIGSAGAGTGVRVAEIKLLYGTFTEATGEQALTSNDVYNGDSIFAGCEANAVIAVDQIWTVSRRSGHWWLESLVKGAVELYRKACMIGDLAEGDALQAQQAWLMNPLNIGQCDGSSSSWERSDQQICVWGDSGLRGYLFGSQNYYYTDPGLDETEQGDLRDASNGTPVDVYYSPVARKWFAIGSGFTFLRGGIIDDGGGCYSVIVGAPRVFGDYQPGLPRLYINCSDIDWCTISPGEHVGEGVALQWVNSLRKWYGTLACLPADPPEDAHCCDIMPSEIAFVVVSAFECDFESEEVTLVRSGNVWTWSGTLACGDALTLTLTCDPEVEDDSGCNALTLHYNFPCASFDEDVTISDCDCETGFFNGSVEDFGDDVSGCECCDTIICAENGCGTGVRRWNAGLATWQVFSSACTGDCTTLCVPGSPGEFDGQMITVGCCNGTTLPCTGF